MLSASAALPTLASFVLTRSNSRNYIYSDVLQCPEKKCETHHVVNLSEKQRGKIVRGRK